MVSYTSKTLLDVVKVYVSFHRYKRTFWRKNIQYFISCNPSYCSVTWKPEGRTPNFEHSYCTVVLTAVIVLVPLEAITPYIIGNFKKFLNLFNVSVMSNYWSNKEMWELALCCPDDRWLIVHFFGSPSVLGNLLKCLRWCIRPLVVPASSSTMTVMGYGMLDAFERMFFNCWIRSLTFLLWPKTLDISNSEDVCVSCHSGNSIVRSLSSLNWQMMAFSPPELEEVNLTKLVLPLIYNAIHNVHFDNACSGPNVFLQKPNHCRPWSTFNIIRKDCKDNLYK